MEGWEGAVNKKGFAWSLAIDDYISSSATTADNHAVEMGVTFLT
jgi:hypothetical protein